MTREKALEAMDRLVDMGYHVALSERDLRDGEMTLRRRWLEVSEISMDKIDLRSLVEVADELELEVGFNPIQGGRLSFTDMPTEAQQRKQAVVGGKRRHPR
jgi:hypothetical protein